MSQQAGSWEEKSFDEVLHKRKKFTECQLTTWYGSLNLIPGHDTSKFNFAVSEMRLNSRPETCTGRTFVPFACSPFINRDKAQKKHTET